MYYMSVSYFLRIIEIDSFRKYEAGLIPLFSKPNTLCSRGSCLFRVESLLFLCIYTNIFFLRIQSKACEKMQTKNTELSIIIVNIL